MDKDEALRLALEALCVAVEPKKGKVYAREFEPIDCYAMHEQAITAIKAALEAKDELFMASYEHKQYGYYKDESGSLKLGDIPQRTWVGLTEEEYTELWGMKPDLLNFFRKIEAKLKEKNT